MVYENSFSIRPDGLSFYADLRPQSRRRAIYLCYIYVYIFIVIYTLALATWRNLKQFTKAQTIMLSCRRLAPLVVVLGSAWAFVPWPLL